ncbi:hypothetical protein [Lysobacter sp. Hz 25]|uniref:hypothetical protein n=1 Tax=Lysobacter sp. Hz 25 TaxID=3383698 RepID=UPI0038D367AA
MLNYHDGQDVRLGDLIQWGDSATGTVVVMITEQAAVVGYVADDWAYLQRGCMIHVPAAGLFHYNAEGLQHDANLGLIARADPV